MHATGRGTRVQYTRVAVRTSACIYMHGSIDLAGQPGRFLRQELEGRPPLDVTHERTFNFILLHVAYACACKYSKGSSIEPAFTGAYVRTRTES